MKLLHIVIISFLILALAACGSANPQPAPSEPAKTLAAPANTAYPAQSTGSPSGQAYPAPAATGAAGAYPASPTKAPQSAVVSASVTPDATKAIVKGVLLSKGKPVQNAPLFLALVVKDATGKEITLSLDKNTAPSTTTDSDGNFVFMNVPPQSYGLIVDMVMSTYALPKPNSPQEQLRVVITSNAPVDLGRLDYPDMPGG